jgi:hypothetical protein
LSGSSPAATGFLPTIPGIDGAFGMSRRTGQPC